MYIPLPLISEATFLLFLACYHPKACLSHQWLACSNKVVVVVCVPTLGPFNELSQEGLPGIALLKSFHTQAVIRRPESLLMDLVSELPMWLLDHQPLPFTSSVSCEVVPLGRVISVLQGAWWMDDCLSETEHPGYCVVEVKPNRMFWTATDFTSLSRLSSLNWRAHIYIYGVRSSSDQYISNGGLDMTLHRQG